MSSETIRFEDSINDYQSKLTTKDDFVDSSKWYNAIADEENLNNYVPNKSLANGQKPPINNEDIDFTLVKAHHMSDDATRYSETENKKCQQVCEKQNVNTDQKSNFVSNYEQLESKPLELEKPKS